MGKLNIPASSRVYLDTAPIIYTIEKIPDYFQLLRPVWLQLQNGEIEILTSELTLMESLVLPIRNSDNLLINAFETLLNSSQVQLIPISQVILKEAARLRGVTNLKTPDAIHVATATTTKCDRFLTNDTRIRDIPDLSIINLTEALAS
ncbi:MAG: type II toxin-antitoxin system VapC family toxin [Chroococcales cyanobacterium]